MIRLLTGDCRVAMLEHGPFDLVIGDPPYGDTCLGWDRRVDGWLQVAASLLKPTGSLWMFGSMRSLLKSAPEFSQVGLKIAQDIVWEKHNGSSFHKDRFRRVHEHVVQFWRADAPWRAVYNDVQKTNDATAKTVRAKGRPAHMRNIERTAYVSVDGGPRLMRSVLPIRSMHGRAIHPTEKPVELLEILVKTSCPEGGLVADFFAGSGAAGEAAAANGRRYVGCELDPQMADVARARLGGHRQAEAHARAAERWAADRKDP